EMVFNEMGKAIDYRVLELNRAFAKLIGLSAETTLGRSMREVHGGTEPQWLDVFGKVALTGQSACFEDYSRQLDRYVAVEAFCPEKGRVAVVFSDITEHRQPGDASSEIG